MKSAMKLGDTVRGDYHGVDIEGVLVSFDMSGYVYVRPTTPVTIYGVGRDEVAFDKYAKKSLSVVRAGPDLSEEQVGYTGDTCLGAFFLRGGRTA